MSDAVGPGDLVLCVNAAPNHVTGRPVPLQAGETYRVFGVMEFACPCGRSDALLDVGVDFAFLTPGKRYQARIWRDGANGGIGGDPFAMTVETKTVTSATKWPIRMEAGGGFAIAITPLR